MLLKLDILNNAVLPNLHSPNYNQQLEMLLKLGNILNNANLLNVLQRHQYNFQEVVN